MVEGGRLSSRLRVILRAPEEGHITLLRVGTHRHPGACSEVSNFGGRAGGSDRINYLV